jgi:hypothetical protein
MFPILLIAIGVAVLAFGARLAVLGAAVGALLGVGLLRLLPGSQDGWLALIIPIGLAALGFTCGPTIGPQVRFGPTTPVLLHRLEERPRFALGSQFQLGASVLCRKAELRLLRVLPGRLSLVSEVFDVGQRNGRRKQPLGRFKVR